MIEYLFLCLILITGITSSFVISQQRDKLKSKLNNAIEIIKRITPRGYKGNFDDVNRFLKRGKNET